jgi:cation diffusion facilitator family transporter
VTQAKKNLRLQQVVTGVGIALFITKLVAWYITRSVAVLTDALESTVNVVAGLIGVYSLYISAKPRDKDHPYGHGKAEFISAAVEGTLIVVAGVVIIVEAVRNWVHPPVIHQLDYGMALIAATAFVNYIMGSYCVRVGRRYHSPALVSGGKHLITDTFSTIGILMGLVALYFTQQWWIDSAVAIIFAAYILFTGYKIVRTSIAGIMDEADEELIGQLVATLNINRKPNWIDLHNLRMIKYGSTLHVDCHLTVPWYLNVHEAHQEIDALSKLVQQQFGEYIELFVHSDGCLDFSCAVCTKTDCHVRKHTFQQKVNWSIDNIRSNEKHKLTQPTEKSQGL